jgi:hypothetical protein
VTVAVGEFVLVGVKVGVEQPLTPQGSSPVLGSCVVALIYSQTRLPLQYRPAYLELPNEPFGQSHGLEYQFDVAGFQVPPVVISHC